MALHEKSLHLDFSVQPLCSLCLCGVFLLGILGANLGTIDPGPGTSGFNLIVFDGKSLWLGVTSFNKVLKRPVDE